jgi:hypothetical protein
MNTRTKFTILVQGTTILGLMFFIGSGCSDNSGLKAQLAAMQVQMQNQAALTAAQIKSAKDDAFRNCITQAAGNLTAEAACKTIQ